MCLGNDWPGTIWAAKSAWICSGRANCTGSLVILLAGGAVKGTPGRKFQVFNPDQVFHLQVLNQQYFQKFPNVHTVS